MRKIIATIFVAAVIQAGLSGAQADIITLSEFSSDSTPAEMLDATIEFSVIDTTLTILVSNLTDGPDDGMDNGFDIKAVYFNAMDNVTGLTLTSSSSGWVLYPWSNATKAGGFGQFDFALIGSVGHCPALVDGETSETFTLMVAHNGGGVSAADFCTSMSIIPPGNMPTLAAAKFVRGLCDDSAFGATNVPEPATITLLGIGCLMLVYWKKPN